MDMRRRGRTLLANVFKDVAGRHSASSHRRGVTIEGQGTFACIVALESVNKLARSHYKVTLEARIWIQSIMGYRAQRSLGRAVVFPPAEKSWSDLEDSSHFSARWNDRETFPGLSVAEWATLRNESELETFSKVLRDALEVQLLPRLRELATLEWLISYWLDAYLPDYSDTTSLASAAISANGIGDLVARDLALSRLSRFRR